MRKLMLTLVTTLCVLGTTTTAAATSYPTRASLRHDCSHVYTQPYYRWVGKNLINPGDNVRRRDLYLLASMRYCARSDEAQAGMKRWTRHRLRWRRLMVEYISITPYVCARGFRSAIPCWIVYRESGAPGESVRSRWLAHNPSGASGPYQLLGWGAIYPALTFAAQMQNHRIAARLWNGGRGASNWACC